ncbi:S9 family peptidase [Halioxenophilus sp. WMMB6]|uniref:S9 family peptidase n=1 Tax=Halioxenophilus sp. WMMB6 TaxID=3073815 RepID=UPI00295F038B|nr:S9 family peptidase [Halioxenophilus sp. WMMB6]
MEPLAYGSWPSTISAEQLVAQSLRLAEPRLDGEYIYWLESRPAEKGRNCIVRARPGQAPEDLLPQPLNARSKANEYGGGCYCVADGVVYFVLADDQRIYRLNTNDPQPLPVVISPEGDYRYGDLAFDAGRQRLLAVREDHSNPRQEPAASIISLDNQGRDCFTLVEGNDFYSSPKLSPDGKYLAWLYWDHPAMPWTDSSCVVAQLHADGTVQGSQTLLGSGAGDPTQSLFQPQWSPDNELYIISDCDNWWRIYHIESDGESPPLPEPVLHHPPIDAEFATPQWVFGLSTWGFVDATTLFASFNQDGINQLCTIDVTSGRWLRLDTPWSEFSAVATAPGKAVVLAANYHQAGTLALWQADNGDRWQIIRSIDSDLTPDQLSRPQPISFGPLDQTAHGFYYPPFNGKNCGLSDEQPPLIVLAHGGPTGQASTAFNIKIQYWCSRGFAVVDVNYRGSTGYGRDFRLALNGRWGVSDVEDVCRAADYLVEKGLADPDRLAIKGSSAGGYTVLAALTFTDTFKAGASLYGIGDLETLARDTHKFEAKYLDSLVGPYPEKLSLYRARSPLYHVEQLNCPVIFFQGDEDKIVPPNQAETMVQALTDKGVPVAYVLFQGEGHGFRQGENIVRAIEAELYFYSQIFHFQPHEPLTPVHIRNLTKDPVGS